jgi:hypothetical protein
MKRSEINAAYREAQARFKENGWALPPEPRWDITDLGLGRFDERGLVLVNLAEEPEHCEKLMYARRDQVTPMHTHKRKKEDIICRAGTLAIEVWNGVPDNFHEGQPFSLKRNGRPVNVTNGEILKLSAGERITLEPGIYHAFWPLSDYAILGEVSTSNDDLNDNFFVDPKVGRFSQIEEDEPAEVSLVSDP